MRTYHGLEALAGVQFFDYQAEALDAGLAQQGPQQRLCLYYKTGAGKSLTALGMMTLWGQEAVLVVAPPSTHSQWTDLGTKLQVQVEAVSHAKFRRPDFKMNRNKAVIADEMHLFGGHSGQGWKKLDKLAMHLQAPMVLASATPNYNDADRVYCIQHILDPHSCKGGYLQFLYQHCTTEQNPFGQMPKVTGFQRYRDAAEYLAALPKVEYLPDDLVYTIDDYLVAPMIPPELETYGLNAREGRIIASQMEERHARVNLSLIDDYGVLRDHVYLQVKKLIDDADGPVLVFATHATVAEAAAIALKSLLVTGGLTGKQKQEAIDVFRRGKADVLVGTASLATGTDGLDQVCNTLIILDDTDDDSLRRQLIGRIMPRGDSTNVRDKQVHRIVLT